MTIRGYSSITGTNQPLVVLDGVPLSNNFVASADFLSGGASSSSRNADIDPATIENIEVLSGLSATVLYGEDGRNGVVLISTFDGSRQRKQGTDVTFRQSLARVSVSNLPKYQNQYGNGYYQNFGWFFSTWGPSFDSQNEQVFGGDFSSLDDEGVLLRHPYLSGRQFASQYPGQTFDQYRYQAYNSVDEFFQSGLSSQTHVSLEHRREQSLLQASYGLSADEGFTPRLEDGQRSNYYRRQSLSLAYLTDITSRLTLSATARLIQSERRTPPAAPASGFGTIGRQVPSLFSDVFYTPRSVDLYGLPYQSQLDGSQTYYRLFSQIQHPLWTLHNTSDTEDVSRIITSGQAAYQLSPAIEIKFRASLDAYSQSFERFINRGGSQLPDGQYATSSTSNSVENYLLTLHLQKQLSGTLSLTAVAGGSILSERFTSQSILSENQFIFDQIGHQNFSATTATTRSQNENLLGIFASGVLAYKDFMYLTLQARNDWTSTLERGNRSILYPSVSLAVVLSDALDLSRTSALDYLKVRAGLGSSAGYPDPYQTRTALALTTRAFVTNDGEILNTTQISNRLGNIDLEHETHTEIELGLDARLYERIDLSISAYTKRSDDLIVDLPLDPATGFTQTTVNSAALSTQGVEVSLGYRSLPSRFQWWSRLQFFTARTIVEERPSGTDQILIAGLPDVGNYAIEDQPYGVLQGTKFLRQGDDIVINSQGYYEVDSEIGIIGDPNPDFNLALQTGFRIGPVSVQALVGYVHGGDILSATTSQLLVRGLTTDTQDGREVPVVLDGVRGDGTPNDIQIYSGDAYWARYFSAREGQIFDGTTVRLREVSVSYDLPSIDLGFLEVSDASFSIMGENLFVKAINFPEGINPDPEVLSTGVGNGQGLDFTTGPASKRISCNLVVKF